MDENVARSKSLNDGEDGRSWSGKTVNSIGSLLGLEIFIGRGRCGKIAVLTSDKFFKNQSIHFVNHKFDWE